MPAELPRALCVSLHDVAPATLADCARILAFLDDLQFGPVALLVIPDFQGTGRNASWWSWIRALARLHAANPILRIALHPTDPRDTTFQRFWRNLRLGVDDRQVLAEDQLISRVTRRTVRSDSPARELRTGRLA